MVDICLKWPHYMQHTRTIALSKIFIIGIYPNRDYTVYQDFVCWCVHTLMYYGFVERFYIKISSFLA